MRHARLTVVRMHVLQPPKANCRTGSCARVFVEPAADVVPRPVRLPAENDIWSRLYNGVQFLILLGKVDVQLLERDRLSFQLLSPFYDTLLEFSVQQFQLPVLSVQ